MRFLKYTFTVAMLVMALGAAGQSNPLRFDRTEWDFGTIREEAGVVRHRFEFTNSGTEATVITRTSVDCGCTTPTYSREPVKSSERGSIEVAFDPKGTFGELTKSVVVFNNSGQHTLLKIKVNVIPRAQGINEQYPIELGSGVRVTSLNEAFGYLALGTTASRAIGIVNTYDNDVAISVATAGSGRMVVSAPKRLLHNEQAYITFTYDLRGRAIYGMLSDRITLTINGMATELPIYATAIAIDNFAGTNRSTAPICNIAPKFHNFGKARMGSIVKQEIRITNTGKSTLIVRSIATRNNTTFSLTANTRIEAGKSIIATLAMSIGDGYGITSGGVTIITNDPDLPMQEIRAVAEIDNQ